MAQQKRPDSYGRGEFRSAGVMGVALIDGVTFRNKAVQYTVVDGLAMVEGDVSLGPVEEVERATAARRAGAGRAESCRWPNNVVPYQIGPSLTTPERVSEAVAHWQANTHLEFVRRTAANRSRYPDYIEFVPGAGCSSPVGRQTGRQPITLSADCTIGNAIHEIGHAVGLWHEQSRDDRDTHVTIRWQSIAPNRRHNFDQHVTDGDDVGDYDYGSIMHFPRDAFSIDGRDTIVPAQAGMQIGQRYALSAGDVAAVNALYPKIAAATLESGGGPPPLREGLKPFALATPHHADVPEPAAPAREPARGLAPGSAPAGDLGARIEALCLAVHQAQGQSAALVQEMHQVLAELRRRS